MMADFLFLVDLYVIATRFQGGELGELFWS